MNYMTVHVCDKGRGFNVCGCGQWFCVLIYYLAPPHYILDLPLLGGGGGAAICSISVMWAWLTFSIFMYNISYACDLVGDHGAQKESPTSGWPPA